MSTFWGNLSIKAKLLFGIGAILTIFAVFSAIVLIFVNDLAGSADEAINKQAPNERPRSRRKSDWSTPRAMQHNTSWTEPRRPRTLTHIRQMRQPSKTG